MYICKGCYFLFFLTVDEGNKEKRELKGVSYEDIDTWEMESKLLTVLLRKRENRGRVKCPDRRSRVRKGPAASHCKGSERKGRRRGEIKLCSGTL